jgi:hypothetical protein
MSLPVVVPVDASPIGIGVVLMQEGQLVAFSSTTLTMTQKRYCQIKKELLAVKLGLMRFRQYMYGRRVESDHKPLVGLLDKPIVSCSPTIQRMRLHLQRFDFQLVYRVKDCLSLSRAPSPRVYEDDATACCEEQVHQLVNGLIPPESTRQRFGNARSTVPTLRLLQSVMEASWPENRSQCPVAVKPF